MLNAQLVGCQFDPSVYWIWHVETSQTMLREEFELGECTCDTKDVPGSPVMSFVREHPQSKYLTKGLTFGLAP